MGGEIARPLAVWTDVLGDDNFAFRRRVEERLGYTEFRARCI